MNYLASTVFLIALCGLANSSVKKWKFDINADNEENWLENGRSENCRGLIFPEEFTEGCMMAVHRMTTNEMILPSNGEVVFKEGAAVFFSEKSNKCIRLKQIGYKNWADPNSWLSEGNKATPDIERIPCRHDDVVFPKDATFGVLYPGTTILVNSIQMQGKNLTNDQWQRVYAPHEDCNEFVSDYYEASEITVAPERCSQKGGCVCQEGGELLWAMCVNLLEEERPEECSKPIRPIGNCKNFCGGVLHLEPDDNFDLDFLKKSLPASDDVDFHASKVIKDNLGVIQIAITDRNDFTGESIFIARNLHEDIEKDTKRWRVKSSTLQLSGYGYDTKASIRSSVFIVFGTFFAVVAVFCAIYAFFVGPLRNYRIGENFRFGKLGGVSKTRRPYVFARFENRDDGGLSMAGSILSLEKAFENPMYGRNLPSSSTTTLVETIPEDVPEAKSTGYETSFKNPIFDEAGDSKASASYEISSHLGL